MTISRDQSISSWRFSVPMGAIRIQRPPVRPKKGRLARQKEFHTNNAEKSYLSITCTTQIVLVASKNILHKRRNPELLFKFGRFDTWTALSTVKRCFNICVFLNKNLHRIGFVEMWNIGRILKRAGGRKNLLCASVIVAHQIPLNFHFKPIGFWRSLKIG